MQYSGSDDSGNGDFGDDDDFGNNNDSADDEDNNNNNNNSALPFALPFASNDDNNVGSQNHQETTNENTHATPLQQLQQTTTRNSPSPPNSIPGHIKNTSITEMLSGNEALQYQERRDISSVTPQELEAIGIRDWKLRAPCNFLCHYDDIPKLQPLLVDHNLALFGIFILFPELKGLPEGSEIRNQVTHLLEKMMVTVAQGTSLTRKKQTELGDTISELLDLLQNCCSKHKQTIKSSKDTVLVLQSTQTTLTKTLNCVSSNVSVYMCTQYLFII